MLEICLSTKNFDLLHSTIHSLVLNPLFSVLIASSRLYSFPDFIKVKNIVTIFLKNQNIEKSVGTTYLKMALFAEKITKTKQIYEMLNATSIIISSLNFWVPEYKLLSLFRTYNVRQIYLAAVQVFFDSPNLSCAYLITNNIFRSLPRIGHKHACINEIEPHTFNGKAVSEILSSFSQELLKKSNSPLTSEELINYICSFPSNYSDEDLPNLVLQYPALSSILVPRFIEISKDPTKISSCMEILKKVSSNPRLEDFRCLIVKQWLLEDMLDCLQMLMNHVVSVSDFNLVWTIFCICFCFLGVLILFLFKKL